MTTAAAALAAAVLLLGRPGGTRLGRIGGSRAGSGEGSRPSRRPGRDPLAAAAALDVLASCLGAGLELAEAARVAAGCAPAELAAALRHSADLLTLGAEPVVAWASPAQDGGDERAGEVIRGLFRLARRSASSGTALADGIAELAIEERNRVTHDIAAAGERAGVLIAGPLGVCFLPAFICLGVVPVVAGLARGAFSSGLL